MIDIEEFEKRYKEFEKLDFKSRPHTFHGFWRYKLTIEKQEAHLLDSNNLNETLSKLGPILRIWQWQRPYEFEYCFEPFKQAIRKVSSAYGKISKFSLTEFDQIPIEELEKIWNELGSIKPQGEYSQGELVMIITKPLMFLWGQTPAFDSVVREKMPLFGVPGFRNIRWESNTWINAMRKLQKYLDNNPEVLNCFKKTSMEKYGTDTKVPYGQFFDLYYWTISKKGNCSKGINSAGREEKSIILENDSQKEEFRNFINLLNNLKRMHKITAEEWREYQKQWKDYPQARSLLIERLKHI